MSLIEQAAKRLEELRRAGAQAPATPATDAHDQSPAVREHVPTPEAVARVLDAHQRTEGVRPSGGARPPDAVAPEPRPPTRDGRSGPDSRASRPRIDLPLGELRKRGFLTPDAPKSQIADEFRIIKRPVLGNMHGTGGTKVANGNLVMVTSALPGEGKTFTALNLAMSVAMELDTTVLLVDGDVAHPDFPNLLGVPSTPGLLDVLTRDGVDVGDALVRTSIENLAVLPAGMRHRRATELLASEQMAILLRELASRYTDRMIIFDSPPLLATTEARVLATHMGQIVMVVAADRTRQHAVNLALAAIEDCEHVMMVLNKARKTDVGTYYGYYADEPLRGP